MTTMICPLVGVPPPLPFSSAPMSNAPLRVWPKKSFVTWLTAVPALMAGEFDCKPKLAGGGTLFLTGRTGLLNFGSVMRRPDSFGQPLPGVWLYRLLAMVNVE